MKFVPLLSLVKEKKTKLSLCSIAFSHGVKFGEIDSTSSVHNFDALMKKSNIILST